MKSAFFGFLFLLLGISSLVAEPLAIDHVRFFPAPGHEKDMVGGHIIASNGPDLPTMYNQESAISIANFKVLAEIKDVPAAGQWTELAVPNTTPYRWLAYAAPAGSHGRIAEIEFYAGAKKLTGFSFNSFSPHDFWRIGTDGSTKSVTNGRDADGQYCGIDCGAQATGPLPTMTPGPGELRAPTSVTLSGAGSGSTIRYTLDGTIPTTTNGQVYSAPIPVSDRTTIAAVIFDPNLAPTPPVYGTYLMSPAIQKASIQIGNSLTQLASGFSEMAQTAGYQNYGHVCGLGGAWTKKLWEVLTAPTAEDEKNPTYRFYWVLWGRAWQTPIPFDNFTMQPRDFNIDEEAEYDIRFINLIRKDSPNVQPWLYMEWTEMERQRPTDLGTEPTKEMTKTFPAATWEESMSGMMLYGEDLEQKLLETDKGGKPPRVLPTALAVGWLHHLVEDGKYPGVGPDEFYTKLMCDSVHLNTEGSYLVECTWYAAFFGESPEGKLLPARTNLTPEQAQIMQRLAWDAVKNYPGCGLYEEGTTPVAAPQFTPGTPNGDVAPVTLSSATPGAWFRYTLDGTVPTRTRGYIYCGKLSMRAGMDVKAIAYKSGMADSAVVEMPAAK